jgi:hypothetical protein
LLADDFDDAERSSQGSLSDGTDLSDDMSVTEIMNDRSDELKFLDDLPHDDSIFQPPKSIRPKDQASIEIEEVLKSFPKSDFDKMSDMEKSRAFMKWVSELPAEQDCFVREDEKTESITPAEPVHSSTNAIPVLSPQTLLNLVTEQDRKRFKEIVDSARDKEVIQRCKSFLLIAGQRAYCVSCCDSQSTKAVDYSSERKWNGKDGYDVSGKRACDIRSYFMKHCRNPGHEAGLELLKLRYKKPLIQRFETLAEKVKVALENRLRATYFALHHDLPFSLIRDLKDFRASTETLDDDDCFKSESRNRSLANLIAFKSRGEYI